MAKVLIAMSGGVDSSAAALLLMEQGYECIGVTMKLFDKAGSTDISDAAAVCERLGIEHLTVDLSEQFGQDVIGRFISAYENGLTPNPCIDCNRCLKFGVLSSLAEELGCDFLATGHYARIVRAEDGSYSLLKAADHTKDQSYVLYQLTQEQLAHTLFPLGGMTKAEIRALAESRGFVTAHKSDSQDICFVPDGDYAAFITRHTGKSYPGGDFLSTDGKVLGRHSGLINYTIGQRKGLGISLGERAYVVSIDAAHNTVTLGRNEDLFSREVMISGLTLVKEAALDVPLRAAVKIRYSHREQPALITALGGGTASIIFDEPQRAVTCGQSAVIYSGDEVIGGGVITASQAPPA